ncbi:MAG TPA: RHS repeat-associated core domain-containing protein [Pyrinomonadaceae bacterium]|nr:RHS repeat-associated core domain-containing protein [Pyrinomonadaceae bacterium]
MPLQKTRNFLRIFLCLALVMLATRAHGQQHTNNERGLSAPSTQTGEMDTVNLYNGNLALTIPIGQSYNTGGNLNYGLTLVYNSNAWDFRTQYDSVVNRDQLQAVPDPKTNAGMGWHLSLGALYAPQTPNFNPNVGNWIYVSPDGSEHRFYDNLHSSDPVTSGIQYTRDNSYLRLNVAQRQVETPDGQMMVFRADGQLSRISDRFGNFLNVTVGSGLWTLSDSVGRVHRVYLDLTGQVYRVELAAFGSLSAAYQFLYDENVAIDRHKKNGYHWPAGQEQARVSLLRRVTLPANGGSYQFDYYRANNTAGSEVSGLIKSAVLPTLGRYRWEYTRYQLSDYGSASKPPLPTLGLGLSIESADGVALKEIADGSGVVIGSWRYRQQLTIVPAGVNTGKYTAYTMTTVSSPEGDETVNYFNTTSSSWDYSLPYTPFTTNPQNSLLFLSQEIYAGPVANNQKRRSVYVRYESDVTAPGTNFSLDSFREFNRRLAQQRTVFHDDSDYYDETALSNFDGLGNYRQTVHGGSFPRNANVEVTRTTFVNYNPGAGQFSFDPETGAPQDDNSFTLPPTTAPWILNTYNSAAATENGQTATTFFCFDQSTGFLKGRRVRNNAPQDLTGKTDVVTRYSQHATGAVSKEEYFGGDNGNAGDSSTALCALLPTLSGNAYQINYDYAYGSLKQKTYVEANGTTPVLTLIDRDIDLNTGLSGADRNASRITTNYEYDVLGRMVWSKPRVESGISNGAWMQLTYTPTSLNTKRWPSGITSGQPLTESTITLDSLGRNLREDNTMPNPSGMGSIISSRVTSYNALGWTLSVSEWMTGTPSRKTSYSDFDPFGRPGTVIAADGHWSTISYSGIRVVTTRVTLGTLGPVIANLAEDPPRPDPAAEEPAPPDGAAEVAAASPTPPAGEEVVATTEIRDQQGRLWKAINDSEGTNRFVSEYFYDNRDRLTVVKLSPPGGGANQSRFFSYDTRGFMLSETQPETGVTSYGNYDALGHPGSKKTGTDALFGLTMQYDRAERVNKIIQASNGRLLKEYTYGSGTTPANRSAGKVVTAIRHNWHDRFGLDVTVSESYTYAGLAGMSSRRDTAVSTGQSFTQQFTYDDLGNVSKLTYPTCLLASCPPSASQVREVNYSYTNGYLTSIPGYVNSITYHPNGLVRQMVYPTANLVTWNQDNDANAIARPARLRTTNVLGQTTGSANFDSGQYKYDGGGNITRIGSDYYIYDRLNRLTEGSAYRSPNWLQTYTYDWFGNVTNILTTDQSLNLTARAIAVDRNTNRVSDPNLAAYDVAGNQTRNGSYSLGYDSFNMAKSLQLPTAVPNVYTADWLYLYTAGDERLWSYNLKANKSYWRLRDLQGNVLREFIEAAAGSGKETDPNAPASDDPAVYFPDAAVSGTVFTLAKDYIYSGRRLVGAIASGVPSYFLLDHLGSPRLTVNSSGRIVESHDYLPFGKEATTANTFNETMKFTGHERDVNEPGVEDDFDYMHARYYNSNYSRFLSPDPGPSANQSSSQSWNRYAYVANNPMNSIDPDGRVGAYYVSWQAGSDFSSLYTPLDAICDAAPADMRASARQSVPFILHAAESEGLSREQLAYVLATMQVESKLGGQMHELYNGNRSTYFESKYGYQTSKGKELGNTKPGDAVTYAGAGYIQITGKGQYARLSKLVRLDLVSNPSAVLDPRVAARIAVTGTLYGQFTYKGLGRYVNDTKTDFTNARRSINGQDRAAEIAGYARSYLNALYLSGW